MMQLGTLGSGNHFLEIGYVDEIYDENFCSNFNISKNSLTMMVHSGSRGLGHQVCSDYIRMMEDSNQELAKNLSDRELIYSKINSEIGQKYLLAMNGASNYAFCNRQILSYLAREVFKKYDISFSLFYDICHNIAKKENLKLENGDLKQVLVHRKGATRAFPKKLLSKGDPFYEFGQPVLLPGSMGTKSYVLISDESEKSLYSLAHGAGRRLSRHKSKHSDFTYDDVMNDLKKENISVFCDSKGSVLEESPKSYKDVDLVVDIIVKNKLSKKAFSIRPILSIKG
jgi:tRNA-splicing ligase RtcB